MTKLLDGFSHNGILQAVEILKNGGIVALPTETVYGLAADATNVQAIAKIFDAKNRPQNHPLILHVKNFDEAKKYVKNVSKDAEKLAKHFWPGALSMLFEKAGNVSDVITGGREKVVVRVPNHKVFQEVLHAGSFALVAPSANLHKKLSPTKAEHVFSQMNGRIDAILEGGDCKIGVESTIIDVTGEEIKILRAGPVLKNDIELVLNKKIEDISTLSTNSVSGSMKAHYKPNKLVKIVSFDDLKNLKNCENYAFVCYSQKFAEKIGDFLHVKMPENASEYQVKLYDVLYELDKTNVTKICIEIPPQTQEWLAICDKLNRMICD